MNLIQYCNLACSPTRVKISQFVNKMCSQHYFTSFVNKVYQCCYFIKFLQACHSQLVDKLLNCSRTSTSCWNKQQVVNKPWTTYYKVDNLSTSSEQAVRTHPDDKLLEQHCYTSSAGLLQLMKIRPCLKKTSLLSVMFWSGVKADFQSSHEAPRSSLRVFASN